MSRQAGIKDFFPTDKAIEPTSASTTPAVSATPSTPAPPSDPGTPSTTAISSALVTPSISEMPHDGFPASLKRGASQALQYDQEHKRLRTSDATGDDHASTAFADENAQHDAGFPNGPVTVWAMTRADLCESQQIFKQYQAGAHTKNKVVTALFINKFTEPRDFLGHNKLITCCGGGREKGANGEYDVRTDTKPSVVPRWEAAVDTPVVVIMGKEHPAFKNLNLPNVVRNRGLYVELGTFMVTKIWTEMVKKDNTKAYKVWKIMLQTMDPTSKPWYWKENIPKDTATHDPQHAEETGAQTSDGTQSTAARLVEQICNSCGKTSPAIFDNAPWVCLDDECKQFFNVAGEPLKQIGSDFKELRYSEAFIDHITTYEAIKNIPTMFEPLRKALAEGGENFGTEAALRGGMTCPQCRCGSARKHWDRLVCRNCGFEHSAAPLPYPLGLVEKETQAHTKRCRVRDDGVTITLKGDHVEQFVEEDEDGTSTRFVYMIKHTNGDLIGTFVVERPSDLAKRAPGGADELYTSIEAEGGSMKLRRNPTRCPDTKNEVLTRHFQSNFGALYEFGPKGIDTKPFENAPDVVLQSLVYLKHFGQKALQSSQNIASRENFRSIAGSTLHMSQKPFNELLALAYRESDSIGWHDDGEAQLTGVISTASFGSPGKMSLRFKKKKNSEKQEKPILEVQLRHGDVATMCDTRLQALTDHAVDPKGVRRYAMTSRTINFDHYRQPKEERKVVQRGLTVDEMEKAARIPDRALNFSYNGTTLGSQEEKAV